MIGSRQGSFPPVAAPVSRFNKQRADGFGPTQSQTFSQLPTDVFVLRWLGAGADVNLDAPMAAAECEILYQTCGCQSFGGLDRGRVLSAMDQELLSMLQPFSTQKLSFTATPPAPMMTRVFWDEPGFGPVVAQKDRLSRSVKVMIYSYQEQGE